jgi:hypothetical protein
MLDKREQQVEDFGLQRYDLAVTRQKAFGGVQPEGAEFINRLRVLTHDHSQKGLRASLKFQ